VNSFHNIQNHEVITHTCKQCKIFIDLFSKNTWSITSYVHRIL
jgi:predicted nucleic-acid-binding Zn-ribbon protein